MSLILGGGARVALVCLAMVPGVPEAQGTRWQLRETLRIGGAESGPASFSAIRAMDVDPKGRILVFERTTQDIRMFGPDGRLVRTIGRSGAGPGEMKNAEGMIIGQGGRIWVRDAANARFTIFGPDGDYEASWTMRFCWSQGLWAPQVDRQGRILDYDCIVGGDARPYPQAILAYRGDRSGVDTLFRQPDCGTRALSEAGIWVRQSGRSTMYVSVPFAPFPVAAIGPSGETWCAPNSTRYELMRFGAGAKDTIRVSRNVPRVPITKAQRDSIIASYEAKGPTGFDYGRIPDSKPAISRITIDGEGRPWVRRTDATGAVLWDVFSATGQFLATAELPPGARAPAAAPWVVRGRTVYTVLLDEDDVPYVVRLQGDGR
ncbi:MAG: hypothetical protein HUU26_12235 [Gemmatimonadaceae bacterium]|nr:hypothetical protein [Gemmatimonadaceae bacterium]